MKFYNEGSKKEEMYPCVICGSNNFEVVWDKTLNEELGILSSAVVRDEEGRIIQGKVQMCKKCGLVQTLPKMSHDDLRTFYDKQYREIYGVDNIQTQIQIEDGHAKTAVMLLTKHIDIKKLIDENGIINFMDVGASTLSLCLHMKAILKENVNVVGVEPNEEYTKACDTHDIQVFNGIVEDYEPDIKFDFVSMTNTLEHLHDPLKTLRHIHDLMADESIIMVSVPNLLVQSPYMCIDAWFSNAHLYHFTPVTLTMLLQKAGFKPIEYAAVMEELGEKIYFVAVKSEVEEVKLDKTPDYATLRRYLLETDAAYKTREYLAKGGMYK